MKTITLHFPVLKRSLDKVPNERISVFIGKLTRLSEKSIKKIICLNDKNIYEVEIYFDIKNNRRETIHSFCYLGIFSQKEGLKLQPIIIDHWLELKRYYYDTRKIKTSEPHF